MDNEIRYTDEQFLLREEENANVIEGYAIVFGQESRLLLDEGKIVREIIMPGAVTRELIDKSDITMTLFHNRESLLARSVNGVGTLSIDVDDHGVKFSFVVPNTPDGMKARELVKRQDLRGCSFSYYSKPASVEYKREGKETIRMVNKVDYLSELTIGSQPAYTQTSVSLREGVEEAEKPKEEEPVEKPNNYREQVRKIRKIAE
jgi:HK97 family phage prohead protease